MRIVIDELEIFEFEVVNAFHGRIDFHSRQRTTFASELFARLLEMIVVKMQIAESMNEIARGKIDSLRDHHRQQRVTRDVEWHAEK